jgi:hypothetical protein
MAILTTTYFKIQTARAERSGKKVREIETPEKSRFPCSSTSRPWRSACLEHVEELRANGILR